MVGQIIRIGKVGVQKKSVDGALQVTNTNNRADTANKESISIYQLEMGRLLENRQPMLFKILFVTQF